MESTSDNDGYCPNTNGFRCYSEAVREIRLQGIREGRFAPRMDDLEEVEAARIGGWIVDPIAHRVSA
jgi:hypothetical protein